MRIRLLLALAVVAVGCGDKGTTTPPANTTVDIYTIGDAFSPTFAEVAVGTTVRWSFTGGSDGLGHNVRFNPRIAGSPADINVLKTGTASRVFNTKGTFKYDCDVHPGMRAEITVQ